MVDGRVTGELATPAGSVSITFTRASTVIASGSGRALGVLPVERAAVGDSWSEPADRDPESLPGLEQCVPRRLIAVDVLVGVQMGGGLPINPRSARAAG